MQLSSSLSEALVESDLTVSTSSAVHNAEQNANTFAVLITTDANDVAVDKQDKAEKTHRKTIAVVTTSPEISSDPTSTANPSSVSLITVSEMSGERTIELTTRSTTAGDDATTTATIVIEPSAPNEVQHAQVLIDCDTGHPVTVRIAVSDLQDFCFDDLSLAVIDAGADFRRQLYLILGSALSFIGANTSTAGVDKVTSVLLSAWGLAVDAQGSINAENTTWGGEQTAIASTYIGNVIPPDIARLLETLGASPDFIEGYNRKRNEIIASLEQYETCEHALEEQCCPSEVQEPKAPRAPIWVDFNSFDAANVKIAGAIFDTASTSIGRALDRVLKDDPILQLEIRREIEKYRHMQLG